MIANRRNSFLFRLFFLILMQGNVEMINILLGLRRGLILRSERFLVRQFGARALDVPLAMIVGVLAVYTFYADAFYRCHRFLSVSTFLRRRALCQKFESAYPCSAPRTIPHTFQ